MVRIIYHLIYHFDLKSYWKLNTIIFRCIIFIIITIIVIIIMTFSGINLIIIVIIFFIFIVFSGSNFTTSRFTVSWYYCTKIRSRATIIILAEIMTVDTIPTFWLRGFWTSSLSVSNYTTSRFTVSWYYCTKIRSRATIIIL